MRQAESTAHCLKHGSRNVYHHLITKDEQGFVYGVMWVPRRHDRRLYGLLNPRFIYKCTHVRGRHESAIWWRVASFSA
jgi:hypothetical protein